MNPVAARSININSQSVPRKSKDDDSLKVLIDYFLGKYSKGVSEFPRLLLISRRALSGQKDPPLDMLWFSAAVEFHCCKSCDVPPPAKFLIVENQFKLLKYHTSECSSVKKVAVLAPVLYLLYHLDLNFSANDPCLRQDISSLVEEMFVYLSSCSETLDKREQCSDDLGVNILSLIRVWGADQMRDNPSTYFMDMFFPILNAELREGVTSCLGKLAAVVLNETLFLRFRLRLGVENYEGDLQSDTLKLSVQTIKNFQNIYFLDLLYKILSERKLLAAASLSSEDAVIMKKSLYDAVILFDYAFYTGIYIDSLDKRSKRLAVQWVSVCNRAIWFSKSIDYGARVYSYRNAFHKSQLVAELINWASSEEDLLRGNKKPDFVTPNSLSDWLLSLEARGVKVTDSSGDLIGTKAETSDLSGCGKRKEATVSSYLQGSPSRANNHSKQLRLESSFADEVHEDVLMLIADHEDEYDGVDYVDLDANDED